MAKISGASGVITFNSVDYEITDWTVNITGETIDVTDSSDTTWKSFIPVEFSEWDATASGFQITGVADPPLQTSYTLKLSLDATRYYTGSAILTGISTVCNIPGADAVKKDYTFKGTGSCTLTNGA